MMAQSAQKSMKRSTISNTENNGFDGEPKAKSIRIGDAYKTLAASKENKISNIDLLYTSIENYDLRSFKKLYKKISPAKAHKYGQTPLEYLCSNNNDLPPNGQFMLIALLMRYDTSTITANDDRSCFPLYVASQYCLAFLWDCKEKGIPMNVVNRHSDTPLHWTAGLSDVIAVTTAAFLLDSGADPRAKNLDGQTPLHITVSCPVRVHEKRWHNKMVTEMIHELLRSGADINSQDASGRTGLHVAQLQSNNNCIFDLLRFGIDVNIEDNEGLTWLDYVYKKLEAENCLTDFSMSREPTEFEKQAFEPVRMIMCHVKCMNVLKLHVKEKLTSRIDDLKDWYQFMNAKVSFSEKFVDFDKLSTEDINIFAEKCEQEKADMMKMKIDNATSMYSFLVGSYRETTRLVRKETFKWYFESENYKKDYPILWYFLEQKYNLGMMRNVVLPYAREALDTFRIPLPSLCLEGILDHFSNNDLIDLIKKGLPLFDVHNMLRTNSVHLKLNYPKRENRYRQYRILHPEQENEFVHFRLLRP